MSLHILTEQLGRRPTIFCLAKSLESPSFDSCWVSGTANQKKGNDLEICRYLGKPKHNPLGDRYVGLWRLQRASSFWTLSLLAVPLAKATSNQLCSWYGKSQMTEKDSGTNSDILFDPALFGYYVALPWMKWEFLQARFRCHGLSSICWITLDSFMLFLEFPQKQ